MKSEEKRRKERQLVEMKEGEEEWKRREKRTDQGRNQRGRRRDN